MRHHGQSQSVTQVYRTAAGLAVAPSDGARLLVEVVAALLHEGDDEPDRSRRRSAAKATAARQRVDGTSQRRRRAAAALGDQASAPATRASSARWCASRLSRPPCASSIETSAMIAHEGESARDCAPTATHGQRDRRDQPHHLAGGDAAAAAQLADAEAGSRARSPR